MALVFMLKRWNKAKKVIPLIIDHSLRPESSQEAVITEKWLTEMGT
jgi:tRNA(Ile)-lysidine synthase TilS/MesJ